MVYNRLHIFIFISYLIMFNSVLSGQENKKRVTHPNILWITCEDISPYLGSYGCEEAYTPNLDKLAMEGTRFTHAYSNAPVCAVARSTILTGMYAPTIGTQHMRSYIQLPNEIPAYPKIFRDAGYYCTNNAKKDYNSIFQKDTTLWNESSKTAHYKNRKNGQPFFSVFNIEVTHESQLSTESIANYIKTNQIPEKPRIDPKDIKLPPYHPDLPEIRNDWARLHDLITLMDNKVGILLDELEKQGLKENTIVFFYSDHGGMLSRSKRYIYNGGTQVPFIIRVPEKWAHLVNNKIGGTIDENVSFVDFAKTVLSIAKLKIPKQMQGRNFLGINKEKAPEFVHFYRDRMSERYDFSRAVTDGEYHLIHNYMPNRPRGRDTRYGNTVQANWRAWEQYYDEGKCDSVQSQFYEPKDVVELFNTKSDPSEINNLYGKGQHREVANKLSKEVDRWMLEIRDTGFIPESMFNELIGVDKKYATIYDYAQSRSYEIERILPVAKKAILGKKENVSDYIHYIQDSNPIIRYWGAYGLFLSQISNKEIEIKLRYMASSDAFSSNRIMANQALGLHMQPEFAFNNILNECLNTKNSYVMLLGLNALQYAHLDNRLTKDNWLAFKEKKFNKNENFDGLGDGFRLRLINDALEIYPKLPIVD